MSRGRIDRRTGASGAKSTHNRHRRPVIFARVLHEPLSGRIRRVLCLCGLVSICTLRGAMGRYGLYAGTRCALFYQARRDQRQQLRGRQPRPGHCRRQCSGRRGTPGPVEPTDPGVLWHFSGLFFDAFD